jgi:hypothetical protein
MQEAKHFFNTDFVMEALGFKNFTYNPINEVFNEKWADQVDVTVPSSREIALLLDQKNTSVLVLNGNNDIVV